jgi:hypothetical protein
MGMRKFRSAAPPFGKVACVVTAKWLFKKGPKVGGNSDLRIVGKGVKVIIKIGPKRF